MKFATPKDVQKFAEWLTYQGCEILPVTNQWEVLRFKCGSTRGIAWTSKKTAPRVSAANRHAKAAWKAWRNGKSLPLAGKPKRAKRMKRTKRGQTVNALIERDGDRCWFCGQGWDDDRPQTVEHLVSIVNGGPNHLSNMVLACEPCNTRAGHLSVAEKVELREMLAMEATPPISNERMRAMVEHIQLAEPSDGGAS